MISKLKGKLTLIQVLKDQTETFGLFFWFDGIKYPISSSLQLVDADKKTHLYNGIYFNKRMIIGKKQSSFFFILVLFCLVFLSCSSLKGSKKRTKLYGVDWHIVGVDMSKNSSYFAKTNEKDSVYLRIERKMLGVDLYLATKKVNCNTHRRITKRDWFDCYVESGIDFYKQNYSSYYIRIRDRTQKGVSLVNTFADALSYTRDLSGFMNKSNGTATIIGDTLILDMKILEVGEEYPFRLKCVKM